VGQTQLIKLRWGADDEGLKFKGADPFIKFALGENVNNVLLFPAEHPFFLIRRMGVEQVLTDGLSSVLPITRAAMEKLGTAN